MGVLAKAEIERRFAKNELVKDARKNIDGTFDLEPASYDLTAGAAIWKEPDTETKKGQIMKVFYDAGKPPHLQPTVTLQPGQMIFVITGEELNMPLDICGTVLPRNNLARKGILALNAGHVDPGFQGPIVIRLISLSTSPWPLSLGEPIFTIVFQTIDIHPEDREKLVRHRRINWDETHRMVQESVGYSMSNALFDLHQRALDKYLEGFVKKDFLWKLVAVVIGLMGLLRFWPEIKALLGL